MWTFIYSLLSNIPSGEGAKHVLLEAAIFFIQACESHVKQEISTILDDEEEPLCKRLKIADNAFKSSELPLHCKPLLLRWILRSSSKSSENTWGFLNEWLNLDHFKKLSRNEIDNKEIKSFIKLLITKLDSTQDLDENTLETVIKTIGLLMENKTYQQYFVSRIKDYCHLLVCILENIQSPIKFIEFMKNNLLFYKSLILAKDFLSHFLHIVLPIFVKYLVRFDHNDMFLQVSKVIQKCIFYNNRKSYMNFMDQFFTGINNEEQLGPKTLIYYLMELDKFDGGLAKVYYKLIFHAFSVAYDNDFELLYRFFVIMLHIQGFEMSQELTIHSDSLFELPEEKISGEKSLDCTLDVLKVLAESKTDIGCKIKDITFSDLLKNLLIDHIFPKKSSCTHYKIILGVIKIDPLIVQSLTDQIIIYSMMANNTECREEYEELIISMVNIYSKLHRVENLVSKMVVTLSQGFDGSYARKNVYSASEKVIEDMLKNQDIGIEDIFTENILSTFSKCISSLASWQIINVFKTLLYSLKGCLEGIHNGEDEKKYIFMQILSVLIGVFLSSIRVAEHTVTSNVTEKTEKCLDELQNLLKMFGLHLLNRKHNHILMRSFLNIAYYWAEMTMTLRYYSVNHKETEVADNNYSPCNLTFIHSYLSVKEWCLISERITNFGAPPCKHLMYKLYIQRVRALHIFLPKVNDDIITNLLRNIAADLDHIWKYLLEDKFSVNILLPKMDTKTVILLAENFIADCQSFTNFQKYQHILNSSTILNVLIYVSIMKINKIISKQKRKLHGGDVKKKFSTRICGFLNPEFFLCNEDSKNILESAAEVYANSKPEESSTMEWNVNEDKLLDLLRILKKFPAIYSSENIQKIYILYFCSLHNDLSCEFLRGNFKNLQLSLENNIIGILQQCKFKLNDILKVELFCSHILENFMCVEETFSLAIENIFRCKESVKSCEYIVSKIIQDLMNPLYMQCSIIIINGINKMKKSKMSKEMKNVADDYKEIICDKVLELVLKNEPTDSLLAGYAYSLKHYLTQNNSEKITELLKKLDKYVQFSFNDRNNFGKIGHLALFITVLQNKSKIKTIEENFPLDVWKACKDNDSVYSRFEDYSQLILLIIGHIPNEHFETFTEDLLYISTNAFAKKGLDLSKKNFKTWEAVLSSNLNPIKSKVLQSAIEKLLYQIFHLLEKHECNEELFESVLNIEKIIIQTNHLHLTSAIMDVLLLNISTLMNKADEDFPKICNLSICLLSSLLKYRKPLIMDRLPPYLQQYRSILRGLCERSNSDSDIEENFMKQISDCAHQLEKLTNSLVILQKDMGRIAMYLIADIINQYEQVTLLSNVKIHLNNCVYSLMSICDQHAVSYLMRVLSSASTEIFKIMYENYKKYYRFTGKV